VEKEGFAVKRITNSPTGEALIAFYWVVYLGVIITHTMNPTLDTCLQILKLCGLLVAAPAYLCAVARRELLPPTDEGPRRLGCQKHRNELVPAKGPVTRGTRLLTISTWLPMIGFTVALLIGSMKPFELFWKYLAYSLLYLGWLVAFVVTVVVVRSKTRGQRKALLLARVVPLAAALPLTGTLPLP
jgi:hypothetical protein